MTQSPRVSVILPTRNRAHSLERAVSSVLRQTHADLELIVVDDASTDGTAALLESMAEPRLRVVRLTQPGGAAAARNRGLAQAGGELVAFQDSDDEWHANKLERQIGALESAGRDAVASVCSFRHVFPGRTRDVIHPPGTFSGDEVARRIVHGLSLGTVSLLARIDAVRAAGGFDETLPRLQDIELCLRLAEIGGFVFLDEVLQDVHFGDDSISADATRFREALSAVVARHGLLFQRYPRGYAYQLYRAGKYCAFERRYHDGANLLVESLRKDPRNWRAVVMLAAIALGLAPALARRAGRGAGG